MFLIIFREFCHIVTDLLSMFPNGLVSTPLYSDTYISQCYWVKEILFIGVKYDCINWAKPSTQRGFTTYV